MMHFKNKLQLIKIKNVNFPTIEQVVENSNKTNRKNLYFIKFYPNPKTEKSMLTILLYITGNLL